MGFVKDVWNGITGKTQAKASERAGNIQADTSRQVADLANKQYEQTRQDQMPWLEAGRQALGNLSGFATHGATYDDVWGRRIDKAYNNALLTGGLTAEQMQTDPSYQWRKQQGLDSIQAQASASGGLLSGATLKALNDYNSNLASQEYNNAWQRDQVEKGQLWNVLNGARLQDYGVFNQERSRNYNELANLAGVGQTTATNLGQFGTNNVQTVGNALTNGANAQANAVVGSANARAGGIGNLLRIGSMAMGAF